MQTSYDKNIPTFSILNPNFDLNGTTKKSIVINNIDFVILTSQHNYLINFLIGHHLNQ
jgi:hypothetical protein